jgi:hypothetical protein
VVKPKSSEFSGAGTAEGQVKGADMRQIVTLSMVRAGRSTFKARRSEPRRLTARRAVQGRATFSSRLEFNHLCRTARRRLVLSPVMRRASSPFAIADMKLRASFRLTCGGAAPPPDRGAVGYVPGNQKINISRLITIATDATATNAMPIAVAVCLAIGPQFIDLRARPSSLHGAWQSI